MKVVVRKTVIVTTGQYTPIPGSDKMVLAGPGKMEVVRYDDGRLDGQVLEGFSKPIALAIAKRWQRVTWEV